MSTRWLSGSCARRCRRIDLGSFAGTRLVRDVVTEAKLASVASAFTDPASIQWLPVAAIEVEGINRIPAAAANRLASKIGGSVWDDVVQANSVGHTVASGWSRLARPALFEGDVLVGGRYVLVDDFIGQGGTLANLWLRRGKGRERRRRNRADRPGTIGDRSAFHGDTDRAKIQAWRRTRKPMVQLVRLRTRIPHRIRSPLPRSCREC